MAIKVKKINEQGQEIIKEIEEGLYSSYINIGWEEVKEPKVKNDIFKQPKSKIEISKENE